ncbi:nitrite reductase large subunit NirB [Beggiatoa leptomitoformis]|uniref:Nitrite reductase large subunit n=1 Tax=Beggiatoa leptomitoformis TaxID=288004 RepID=A0A2N9YHP0_9GAMM|nr:nitrite reductase large subunit NirB [Beggiatoa leptomitoformis]ALG67772.1 nitrite reductase large subunit [Beggiatoa leptomitoformis]AUI69983.1 nitrite reductase large subunit [Beggiatoa leptomitoformis]
MKKRKLICIGNGMAGMRTVEELLALTPDLYEITVFGTEQYGNYNRILLSPVLSGEKAFEDIMIHNDEWYATRGITLHKGHTVTQINRQQKTVTSDNGITLDYDKLLIATGSNPFMLPVAGSQLAGIVAYRDIRDVEAMLTVARSGTGKHAVVIGGGLLGLEAAYGLQKQGMTVTVVHLLDTLMERQLDKPAANLLKAHLEKQGLNFRLEAQTDCFLGENHVQAIRFKDGHELPADLIVMAVGIRPNINLAKSANLECGRGLLVNDHLQTSDNDVFAVGECVEHRQQIYGLVAPLYEQAKVCAHHLADIGGKHYEGSVTSTKLKVTGVDVFSAGDFLGNEKTESIIFQDPSMGIYKKLVLEDNKVKGAVMVGDTTDGAWYFQLLRDGEDVSTMRERILFGQAFALTGDGGSNTSLVASMADDNQICGCNGVCKGTIVQAIQEKGLTTLEEVRKQTGASASCGGCSGLVEQLLMLVNGEDAVKPTKKIMCACTDMSHDEVREAITHTDVYTVAELMKSLNWKTPDGCTTCRPALNYYLLSTHPDKAQDDYQSRFINERAHANIQKDGTYSVVPRIWGGLTTPDELRAIANVADKYSVPTVKITGGQRIDLLGVKKEDLPAMWADLNEAGMVSGYAYGKSLRTVKTCVGSTWCRFGTQDAMGMGIKLEQMTWGSWTPHKVKLAVSGCPRNCAEATIKDFGVVAVDSGWELHVGGNGGIKVRATDLLCKVNTEEEVMEYCGAFMQIYREEARYLERTAHWIERVGVEYVKKQIVENAENRKHYYDRFLQSQITAQKDPWAERAKAGVHEHEFKAMKHIDIVKLADISSKVA